MELNIIHLNHRKDRVQCLVNELNTQGIINYKLWEGIWDRQAPKSGIAKAHKQIVSWAQHQKRTSIIIAEDDIKFTSKGAFEYFIQNEPYEYDIYLGGITYGKLSEDNSINDFAGLTLYKIHQRFYNTFLQLPEDKDLDRSLANQGRFIVCEPIVVTQHDGFSDNKQRFQNYEPYLNGRRVFRQSTE